MLHLSIEGLTSATFRMLRVERNQHFRGDSQIVAFHLSKYNVSGALQFAIETRLTAKGTRTPYGIT